MQIINGKNSLAHAASIGNGTINDPFIPVSSDFFLEAKKGNIKGHEIIHKFGKSEAVSTEYKPVCVGGIYNTPLQMDAKNLRIKAGGNANDSANGDGARKVIVCGLGQQGQYIEEEITTNGTSASAATTEKFFRLFRAYVSETGTYANQTTPSHSGDIVIESSDGLQDWAIIQSSGFARAQSEIACYTVPAGKTAYISSIFVSVDSNKAASVIALKRENALTTQPPHMAMRTILELGAISGEETFQTQSPLGDFPENTDILFMAKTESGTAEVDVDFEIILIDQA